jgi:hypothetical protein
VIMFSTDILSLLHKVAVFLKNLSWLVSSIDIMLNPNPQDPPPSV